MKKLSTLASGFRMTRTAESDWFKAAWVQGSAGLSNRYYNLSFEGKVYQAHRVAIKLVLALWRVAAPVIARSEINSRQ